MPVMHGPGAVRTRVGAPDAVHGNCAVVREADHVAVAREVLAELTGHGQPGLRRTQHDLGGPQGSGREHHDVRTDEASQRAEGPASGLKCLERHAPTTAGTPFVGARFDGPHRRVGEDLRAVPVGVGEVVHQHGVLRAVVASGDAVPAAAARVLLRRRRRSARR